MSTKTGRGRCGCYLEVGTVYGRVSDYPLSANGWTSARKKALAYNKSTGALALVDLACGKRRMALYQCYDNHCGLESVAPAYDDVKHPSDRHTPLAGHRRRR